MAESCLHESPHAGFWVHIRYCVYVRCVCVNGLWWVSFSGLWDAGFSVFSLAEENGLHLGSLVLVCVW